MKEYVEFKRERDLGSIITDAFKFIRLEGKNFFITILKFAGIPIVIAMITMIFYMHSISNFVSEGFSGGLFFLVVIIMLLAYLFAIIFVNLAGMFYIKSYIDNKGTVNKQEIITNTKQRFWSFVGFGTLAYFILIASAMLCVLPVFYTMTALSLGASILIFENESATSAIGKCFEFIKGHFFPTLGTIIVVGILVSILGYVFQIPAFIYQMVKMGISVKSEDPTTALSIFSDPIYLFLNMIAIVGNFLFYSLTLITNVFLYFDVNEQKNATGTFETIDALGQ